MVLSTHLGSLVTTTLGARPLSFPASCRRLPPGVWWYRVCVPAWRPLACLSSTPEPGKWRWGYPDQSFEISGGAWGVQHG